MTEVNTKQFTFTEEQLAKLMAMQDTLNTMVHPEWKAQGFDWGLAIVDECLEIKGHLGWKWWKDSYKTGLTEANKRQVQLEVIDILHFILSLDVQEGALAGELEALVNQEQAQQLVDTAAHWVLADAVSGDITINTWAVLAHSVDLTTQQILDTYIQKYVLNKFRQDHGYKDGTYVKTWEYLLNLGKIHDGVADSYVSQMKEDNEVLTDVVVKLAEAGQDTTDEQVLYSQLELYYNSRLNK